MGQRDRQRAILGFSRGVLQPAASTSVLSNPRRSSSRRGSVRWLLRTGVLGVWAAASLLIPSAATASPGAPERQRNTRPAAVARWSGLLAEASLRTGLPAAWLRDLMRVESNGNALAVSSKGAVGLMQLMPATYAALRAPLGLGADPFTPRDNILAGAIYLRLLVDRYGWPAALAGYNAGPGRLDDLLAGRRPLPVETVAYLSRFTAAPTPVGASGSKIDVGAPSPDPAHAPLFVSPQPDANTPDVAPAPRRGWREGGLFASNSPPAASPASR